MNEMLTFAQSEKKIVLTGPESTGKSSLCSSLSKYYKVPFVDEYARTYIDQLGRAYIQSDLSKIAIGQYEWIKRIPENTSSLIDTDLLTIIIWSEYKYSNVDQRIIDRFYASKSDFYLLCSPDLKWTPDPQRENSNDRDYLFDLYERSLKKYQCNYGIVSGIDQERFDSAKAKIDQFVSSN